MAIVKEVGEGLSLSKPFSPMEKICPSSEVNGLGLVSGEVASALLGGVVDPSQVH